MSNLTVAIFDVKFRMFRNSPGTIAGNTKDANGTIR